MSSQSSRQTPRKRKSKRRENARNAGNAGNAGNVGNIGNAGNVRNAGNVGNVREGCRYIDESDCDWYHYILPDKIPPKASHTDHIESIFDSAVDGAECDTCCHVECKKKGIIRQKSGNSDAKNCLCDSHFRQCNNLTEKYKNFSARKGDIIDKLKNTDRLVEHYVKLMSKSGLCMDEKNENYCQDAESYIQTIEPIYINQNTNYLGKEVEARRQYMNSCVDDDPEKICKSSSSHMYWLNNLDALYSRAIFMKNQIDRERKNITKQLHKIRNPPTPSSASSPSASSPSASSPWSSPYKFIASKKKKSVSKKSVKKKSVKKSVKRKRIINSSRQ